MNRKYHVQLTMTGTVVITAEMPEETTEAQAGAAVIAGANADTRRIVSELLSGASIQGVDRFDFAFSDQATSVIRGARVE